MRAAYWRLLQLVTAVVVFFLLAAHMSLLKLGHFVGIFGAQEPSVSWSSVTERAASAGWTSFYVILLAVGLYHGLYGLRAVLLELSLPSVIARSLDYALVAVGVAVFAFGSYIAISAHYY